MSKSKRTNRSPQKPKSTENRPMMEAMQGKRFSNAAGFHKPKSSYDRNDKSWKKGY